MDEIKVLYFLLFFGKKKSAATDKEKFKLKQTNKFVWESLWTFGLEFWSLCELQFCILNICFSPFFSIFTLWIWCRLLCQWFGLWLVDVHREIFGDDSWWLEDGWDLEKLLDMGRWWSPGVLSTPADLLFHGHVYMSMNGFYSMDTSDCRVFWGIRVKLIVSRADEYFYGYAKYVLTFLS